MHLENHSEQIGELDGFCALNGSAKSTIGNGVPVFPYDTYRRYLGEHGSFPLKTFAEAAYSCDVESSDGGKKRRYRLEILDVPGDRFYDLAMYGQDYAGWCDELEALWDREQHEAINTYRKTLSTASALDVATVIAAYRELLAQLAETIARASLRRPSA